jgi:predicted RNase H-like nuclease (RuvC/YqgF family)
MKQIITFTLLLLTTLSSTITAQHISSESYNTKFLHEDFNSEGEHFKTVTTTDNYFILDKGDYLLSRNNNESEYAIIANNSSAIDFVLKTAIRIGPSDNKKASIGIVLKAQQDGKGAVIFEINKKREYRIKQLLGNSYQALSGNAKQEGWVKNKLVNGVDEHNFIEIRTEKNIYDVYVNSEYLTSFFVPDFTSGSCGIIISPETKARISYYYINKKGEGNPVASYTNENTASVNETIEELNKRIKLLEENNAKLNNLNADSKVLQSEEIKDLKQKNADLENNNKSLEEKINILNTETTALKTKNSELAAVTIEQEKEIKLLKESINDIRVSENNSAASNKQLNKKITALKQQIVLEKAISTELTNDLNKTKKSSSTETNKLTAEVKTLKGKLNKLQTANTNLSADLSNATSVHQKSKSSLSKTVSNKTSEINVLTAELNNAREQLKSANKTSSNLKDCKTTSATLSADLKKINKEVASLRTTQNAHDKVTSDLNTQITNLTAKIEALNSQLTTAKNTNLEFETTNAELKELFIQKDFELNGVKPSEMVKQTTTHTVQPKVLNGNNTVYSVQLGMFMQTQSQSAFKDLNSVWYQSNDNGTYQYLSGEFSSPKEAANHKSEINAKGYKNAFIVTITK